MKSNAPVSALKSGKMMTSPSKDGAKSSDPLSTKKINKK